MPGPLNACDSMCWFAYPRDILCNLEMSSCNKDRVIGLRRCKASRTSSCNRHTVIDFVCSCVPVWQNAGSINLARPSTYLRGKAGLLQNKSQSAKQMLVIGSWIGWVNSRAGIYKEVDSDVQLERLFKSRERVSSP